MPNRIRFDLRIVNRAIDLDDEPMARRVEVDDVAIERSLPPKASAELATAKLRPKQSFAARRSLAHLARSMDEKQR